mmetsp:Transcript_5372/g.7747  ORF Transcript_5372/g.7747 Transcript_5372/m.7747 type:complete len:526 (+) Transcript_5372:296-1873(+)
MIYHSMKTIYFLEALLISSAFGSFEVTTISDSLVPSSDDVTYSCSFENEWSLSNHPIDYPSSAHWSPPVLVAHSSGYSMWREDGLATDGVEQVAETGSTRIILNDIAGSSSTGDVVTGRVTFNSNTQMQTLDRIEMTPTNRQLSTITMIAPSPDWFTGFYDFDAVNSSTQSWLREFIIETYPFDAGTEEGGTYSLGNPPTNPAEPILRLDVDTVPSTGVFLNNSGDEVLPVARWTCTLDQEDPQVDTSGEAVDTICFPGRSTVQVKGKGSVSLRDLKIGDEVKVGADLFDRVYSFGHRTTSGKFPYLQITTTGKNLPIEISKDHMLFIVDQTGDTETKRAVPASYVTVGDWLHTDSGDPVRVKGVTPVFREGAYAPFTMTGKIVVNGIVSSNYISFFQGTDAVIIGGMKMPVTMHFVAHMFTSPLRLLAAIGIGLKETYNIGGLSNSIAVPYAIAKKLLALDQRVFGIALLFGAIIVMSFYVIELVLSSTMLLGIFVFAMAVAFFRNRFCSPNKAFGVKINGMNI